MVSQRGFHARRAFICNLFHRASWKKKRHHYVRPDKQGGEIIKCYKCGRNVKYI